MSQRRRVVLGFGLMFFVAAAAMAVVLSTTRQQRVTRPPAAAFTAPSTVTVVKEVVSERYVFSGELKTAVQDRRLPSDGVVTGMPLRNGARPVEGRPVLEVNGRPVIALGLPFPLWRDLRSGTSGKDVVVVQRALLRLGLYRAPVNGRFTAVTAAAVDALYARTGYSPPASALQGEDSASSGDSTEAEEPAAEGGSSASISLASSEIVAIGGGPWRLSLNGAVVGTELSDEIRPRLIGRGARLMVDDGGELAQLDDEQLAGMRLVSDEAAQRVRVVSARVDGDGSVLIVKALSGAVESGPVTGSVVKRRTPRPVLVLPMTALRPTPNGNTSVELLTRGGGSKEVVVDIGLRGDALVEVSGAGLTEGSKVVLPQ